MAEGRAVHTVISRKQLRMWQRTNVEDLLDDGVENDSDRAALDAATAAAEYAEEENGESELDISGNGHAARSAALPIEPTPDASTTATPISYLGLLLGAAFVAGGLFVLCVPRDALIYHAAITYVRPSVEPVSQFGAQVYAVIAVAIGIGIWVLSAKRIRQGD